MKRILFLSTTLVLFIMGAKAQADSLQIYYYEDFPYAYKEGTKLKGIEIDIIEEYVNWLKQKKNLTIAVTYKPYSEFGLFYNAVKSGGPKVIGLGSVTDNSDREKEVLFSPPYLENISVLITDGTVPTIKSKDVAGVSKVLGDKNAMAVNESCHIQYLNQIKKLYIPGLRISLTGTQDNVLDAISKDKKIFGYVDIVAYWSYLKANPSKFLKMQKLFNEPKEFLGFIMPKNSLHTQYINEFFEGGFGFTSTKLYQQILEKYLGYEVLESVEIN